MPKVSIIIPVYNVEKYLQRCMDSVLTQSFEDYEIILVDDGSPDNSSHLCDEYAKMDIRVKVIHKKNGGLTSARLAGYRLALGEYIAFLDSDDYINKNMIEKMYNAIVDNASQLALCSYYLVTENECKPMYLPYKQINIEKEELVDKYILPLVGRIHRGNQLNVQGFLPLRMFKRSIVSEDCFVSEREYYTEDDIFNIIVSKKVDKITVVNEPLYYYCQNPNSLTNVYRDNMWRMLLKRYYFCKQFCDVNISNCKSGNRLDFALLSAVSKSIDNACRLNDYFKYKEEVRIILESEETNQMLRDIDASWMTNGQKAVFYLCRLKAYKLLYMFRKFRMR